MAEKEKSKLRQMIDEYGIKEQLWLRWMNLKPNGVKKVTSLFYY